MNKVYANSSSTLGLGRHRYCIPTTALPGQQLNPPINVGSVIAGNGRFVAIPARSSSAGAYSDDGVTWTETTLPEEKSWKSLVYGNGKFYAFAASDTYATSEDGINWVGDVYEIRNNRGENITDRVKSALGIA